MDREKILSRVDELRDWTVQLLMDMVKIPTVSPRGEGYGELVEILSKALAEQGLEVIVHRVPQDLVDKKCPPEARGNPRYIVMVRLGSGSPVLHFNGHYDVVPGGSGWTVTEPFKPVVKEGRIYGRGTTDMKGGLASMAAAMVALSRFEGELGMTVEAVFVPDEEIGGECGTGYLVEKGLSKPDYVVVAEPSGASRMWIGHKGAVWAEIVVEGKPAHGSTPWLGVNAFEGMVEVARRFIEELKPRVESRKSKYTYDMPGGEKATMMIGGKVRGGDKVNQVPGVASFSIDRRVIPEESAEEAWREIEEFTRRVAEETGIKATAKLIHTMNAVVTEPDTPLVRAASAAAREVLGSEPEKTVCIGGLDLRYYVERGVQGISYGPGVSGTAHAPDEYVEIRDLVDFAKMYALLPFTLREELG